MQVIFLILALTQAAMVVAAPKSDANTIAPCGDSGCFPFADPSCGVSSTFCQCANGHFYLFNDDTKNCNPPWGYVTDSEPDLPGYSC